MTKRRQKEWFDNDVFWRELYPFMFPEQRFTQTHGQIEKVLALTRPSGNTALDLCCGPGRYCIALAQLGFTVAGVDKTKYLLDRARSKTRAEKAMIEWVRIDMRDFIRADTFDLVLSRYTSFGYFDDQNDDLRVTTYNF